MSSADSFKLDSLMDVGVQVTYVDEPCIVMGLQYDGTDLTAPFRGLILAVVVTFNRREVRLGKRSDLEFPGLDS